MGMNKPAEEIWQTDLSWVRQADAVIAEVTSPSLGVGYEIAKAEGWNIPILALYHPVPERKLSAMILGNPHVENHEYTALDEAVMIIEHFIEKLS
jgi:nucleoside 2-deoxyribosyltransferase